MRPEYRQRTGRILLGLLIPFGADLCARQVSAATEATIFPSKRFVKSFIADGTAHRFGVEKLFEVNEVAGSIGGVVPVVEGPLMGFPVQVSLGASAHMVLNPRERIAVISTEYYLDFFVMDVRWSEHMFTRLGLGHTSHHLGDNGVVALQRSNVVDYSRDYLDCMGGYSEDWVRIYAGVNYGYGFVIDQPESRRWLLETGGEVTLLRLSKEISGFWAFDLKFRQESGFGSTQRYRAGIEVERGERILRLALTYKTGLEERGQFYQQRSSSLSAGFFLDL